VEDKDFQEYALGEIKAGNADTLRDKLVKKLLEDKNFKAEVLARSSLMRAENKKDRRRAELEADMESDKKNMRSS